MPGYFSLHDMTGHILLAWIPFPMTHFGLTLHVFPSLTPPPIDSCEPTPTFCMPHPFSDLCTSLVKLQSMPSHWKPPCFLRYISSLLVLSVMCWYTVYFLKSSLIFKFLEENFRNPDSQTKICNKPLH